MQLDKMMCNYFEIRAIKGRVRAIVSKSGAIISKTRAIILYKPLSHLMKELFANAFK